MKRIAGGVAACALLLAGCGSAPPVAQTVTSMVTSVATKTAPTTVVSTKTVPTTVVSTVAITKVQKTTIVETTTEAAAAGIDFDPVHTDVRTAGSPAFDGWTNDSMAAIERMVCGIYAPKDKTDAAGKAGTVSAILDYLGVPKDSNVSTFQTIVTGVCPESLGYLPVF